jgi:plasmid stabilization system protein ParE
MTFEVVITPEAEDDLDAAYNWLAGQTEHSSNWYNGLIEALWSLEDNPARCAFAPESRTASEEVRQLLYGHKRHAYRILFSIRANRVMVLQIRHAARAP